MFNKFYALEPIPAPTVENTLIDISICFFCIDNVSIKETIIINRLGKPSAMHI